MHSNILSDSRTFEFLLQIDRDLEAKAAEEPCLSPVGVMAPPMVGLKEPLRSSGKLSQPPS